MVLNPKNSLNLYITFLILDLKEGSQEIDHMRNLVTELDLLAGGFTIVFFLEGSVKT